MKVAKASENDINVAMELSSTLDSLTGWSPRVPEAVARAEDPEDGEPFDRDDREQCVRVLGHLLDLADRASVMRVVMGAAVMLDPANKCVHPDLNHIEHHPHAQAGFEAKKPRPLAEWTPAAGVVLWWAFPVADAPWVGQPTDDAWPARHTHWTPIIVPELVG